MRIQPIVFIWSEAIVPESGEIKRVMVPQPRYAKIAARQFVDGQEYPLAILETRSRASHNQFFAALHEGFQNLPEKIAPRFPTEDHLRKWLLCETGWFDEDEFDFETEKQANRLARWIRTDNEYARIKVVGTRVIVRRAKSQSAAAMGKDTFEQSKRDVLDLLEAMTNVPRGTLKREAGRAA